MTQILQVSRVALRGPRGQGLVASKHVRPWLCFGQMLCWALSVMS